MIENYGVFIGLVNTPIGKEKDIHEQIDKTFEDYKEQLLRFNSNYKQEENASLFIPTFYVVFGSYDIMAISKVDDFGFGYQKFNANFQIFKDEETVDHTIKSFNYHVYNCTASKPAAFNYDELFPQEEAKRADYCSVTSLKIKSSLLIGIGITVIQEIKSAISKKIEKYNDKWKNDKSKQVSFMLLDTSSWHELTLVITGECLHTIGNVVYWIRECASLDDLSNSVEIRAKSLYAKWSAQDSSLPNTNVFATSNTYFGVSLDRILKSDESFDEWMRKQHAIKSGKIDANVRITTIPTEYEKTETSLKFGDFETKYILYNDADIEPIQKENEFERMLMHFRKCYNSTNAGAIKIRRTHTTPKIQLDLDLFPAGITLYGEGRERGAINESLNERLPLTAQEIKTMQSHLAMLRVSKAVRQRLLKVCSNYNDIILDKLLYAYMIDMRLFIMGMKGFLEKEVGKIQGSEIDSNRTDIEVPPPKDAHILMEKVNGFCRLFEHVYYNIIQHSLRSMDLSEFNLDFNGGIQQKTTVANFVFGLFRSRLGFYNRDRRRYLNLKRQQLLFHSPCVAYLSNTSGIKSYEYSVQLNYFNITEPATFLVTIFKEAFNHLLMKSKHEAKNDEIKWIWTNVLAGRKEEVNKKLKLARESGHDIAEFDIIFHLLRERPKTGSIKLQQEVMDVLQKRYQQYRDVEELLKIFQYVQFIDDFMIQYILTDYNNYKYYYLEDKELYCNWYWIHFFQEPDNYSTDGEVSINMFLKALFRMAMLQLIVECPQKEQDYDSLRLRTKDDLSSVWYRQILDNKGYLFNVYFDSIFDFCQILHKEEFLCGCLRLKDIGNYKMDFAMSNSNGAEGQTLKKYKEKCDSLFSDVLIGKPSVKSTYSFLVGDGADLMQATEKNAVANRDGLFERIRTLFLSYLGSLLKHTSHPIKREGKASSKNEDVEYINVEDVAYGKIQPDPNGGFFVTGDMKRRYFLANNYLSSILYNYTMICKLDYFNEIKEKASHEKK